MFLRNGHASANLGQLCQHVSFGCLYSTYLTTPYSSGKVLGGGSNAGALVATREIFFGFCPFYCVFEPSGDLRGFASNAANFKTGNASFCHLSHVRLAGFPTPHTQKKKGTFRTPLPLKNNLHFRFLDTLKNVMGKMGFWTSHFYPKRMFGFSLLCYKCAVTQQNT